MAWRIVKCLTPGGPGSASGRIAYAQGSPSGRSPLSLDLIVIGIAIALDPLPLIPFILILTSRRGTAKAISFLIGWFLTLSIITAGTLLLTGGEPPSSGSVPTTAGLAVRIAIGVGLVAFGLYRRARIGQPPRKPKKEPGWQKSIDNMSLWFAVLLAPITQPWGLMAAGVTSVMEANASSAASLAMLVVFVVLASSTYLGLVIFALIRQEKAHSVALWLRTWIEGHLQQALAYGSLLVGLFLIGSGTYQLIT